MTAARWRCVHQDAPDPSFAERPASPTGSNHCSTALPSFSSRRNESPDCTVDSQIEFILLQSIKGALEGFYPTVRPLRPAQEHHRARPTVSFVRHQPSHLGKPLRSVRRCRRAESRDAVASSWLDELFRPLLRPVTEILKEPYYNPTLSPVVESKTRRTSSRPTCSRGRGTRPILLFLFPARSDPLDMKSTSRPSSLELEPRSACSRTSSRLRPTPCGGGRWRSAEYRWGQLFWVAPRNLSIISGSLFCTRLHSGPTKLTSEHPLLSRLAYTAMEIIKKEQASRPKRLRC